MVICILVTAMRHSLSRRLTMVVGYPRRLACLIVAALVLAGCQQAAIVRTDVTVGEVVRLAREGRVTKIRVQGEQFSVLLNDGTSHSGMLSPGENLRAILEQAGGIEDVDRLFDDRSGASPSGRPTMTPSPATRLPLTRNLLNRQEGAA